MNCEQTRPLLAEMAYGVLAGERRAKVAEHVCGCAACTAELHDLEAVRRLLDEAPAPTAAVDIPALYRRAAQVQWEQTRRWRRIALTVGAAAAALLLVALLRVELRWHDRELVIGWGGAPVRQAPRGERVAERSVAPQLLGDLQVLRELAHEIAYDAQANDEARREEIARLEKRLNGLAAASEHHWVAARNDVRALYTAYFGVRSQGDMP